MSKSMFSDKIVASDAFLDMPLSAQALYFHLGMNADNDGFVQPKKIMRMVNAANDDLQILIAKRFILVFESGAAVIKHWWINNTKRGDRHTPTTYQAELAELDIKPNKAYTRITTQLALETEAENHPTSTRQPNGNQMATQYNTKQYNTKQHNTKQHTPAAAAAEARALVDYYNQFFGRKILATDGRIKKLKLRLKTFTVDQIKDSIMNASRDDFFNGGGSRGWLGDLDFLIRSDENIEKYLAIPKEQRGLSKDSVAKYV